MELAESVWEQFYNLGIYESNVIFTTGYSRLPTLPSCKAISIKFVPVPLA